MKTRFAAWVVIAAILAAPGVALAQSGNAAQQNNSNTWSTQELTPIVNQVRKQILGLSDYSVFDWLTFSIQGRTVVLNGYASRPILKSEAGNVVKNIKGVESVQNEIEVLPNSPMDDHIRVQALARVYGQPALRKYTNAPIRQNLYPTVARMAGGITQDPPVGYFAIHIIVHNGHLTLEGMVDSQMDANIAVIQANSVPGVFSVTDNLMAPGNHEKVK